MTGTTTTGRSFDAIPDTHGLGANAARQIAKGIGGGGGKVTGRVANIARNGKGKTVNPQRIGAIIVRIICLDYWYCIDDSHYGQQQEKE